VINLSKVIPLAEQYACRSSRPRLPAVGEGAVFAQRTHDRRLVAALLAALAGASYVLLRLEVGARILALGGRRAKLERMV
jgi:hypothetical protein